MKNPIRNKNKAGFTLVELLVVIAIIAVLAAASFAGAIALKEKAKRTTAQAAATALLTAVNQFYAEYSTLPDVGGNTTTTANNALLNILLGIEGGNNIQNDRKIRFLEVKEAKSGNRDGLVYNADGSAVTGMFDPWGQPYTVVLDTDYDERLSFNPSGSSAVNLNGRRVAVYSLGAASAAEAGPNTLVKTW